MPDPIQGVTGTGPLEIGQAGQAGTPPAAAPATPANSSASPSNLDLADVARAEALLATITQAAGSVAGIDAARVAALQQAIQSGTYRVDPQQIAQKLLELEKLLGSQGGGK